MRENIGRQVTKIDIFLNFAGKCCIFEEAYVVRMTKLSLGISGVLLNRSTHHDISNEFIMRVIIRLASKIHSVPFASYCNPSLFWFLAFEKSLRRK